MYRRQGPGCLSGLIMLAVGALGILVILSLTGVINPLGQLFENPAAKVNAPGPAIVQQLRARNEWITFSYQADQLIEASRDVHVLHALHRAIAQGNREERTGLAQVFAISGDAASAPILQGLTKDADPEVAAEALRSLRTLKTRLP